VFTWTGFLLSLVVLLFLARRSLVLGMGVAAAILAAYTLTPREMVSVLRLTLADPSVLLLALVVGLIPMIGGALEVSGEMDRLVSNMRVGTRPFLALAPALLGMLPMPGGALLSAPLLKRGAPTAAGDVKAAANVWFRHTLLLVYPLGSALIASAKIASLDVYRVIPLLVPAFLLMFLLGYFFLLRGVTGRLEHAGPFSLRGLVLPLVVILLAPALDLLLESAFRLPYAEVGTAAGVGASLLFAAVVGRLGAADLLRIARTMRPWTFSLIIVAVFIFLHTFEASGVPGRLAALPLPPVVLIVIIGLFLGIVTGRAEAPVSIVVPIYLVRYGPMSAGVFSFVYFASFLGYLITPTHPCISVSLAYFSTPLAAFLRRVAVPVAIAALVLLVAGILFL
jgi:hypothetical protein